MPGRAAAWSPHIGPPCIHGLSATVHFSHCHRHSRGRGCHRHRLTGYNADACDQPPSSVSPSFQVVLPPMLSHYVHSSIQVCAHNRKLVDTANDAAEGRAATLFSYTIYHRRLPLIILLNSSAINSCFFLLVRLCWYFGPTPSYTASTASTLTSTTLALRG